MPFFHSREEEGKRSSLGMARDFRHQDRVPAQYFSPLDGLALTGHSARNLLREFRQRERPLLYLYLPRSMGGEEARDLELQRLGRNNMILANLSPDREAVSYMREHSEVRFGFEHGTAVCTFETKVLGSLDRDCGMLLVEKPGTLFLERRNFRRYQLWPEYGAYLGWMRVNDISWSGLGIFSDMSLRARNVLENPLLSLPPVLDLSSDESVYQGAKIKVPRAVVMYRYISETCCFCGLYFEREWGEEQAEWLDDFLLGLWKRKHPIPESKMPPFCRR